MTPQGWGRSFDDPIKVEGRKLTTLRDAADYIMKLPKAEQQKTHWQLAVEVLIMAAEGRGPLLHARVGMLRALNHGEPGPQPTSRQKSAKNTGSSGSPPR
jgi:hypothetical protein